MHTAFMEQPFQERLNLGMRQGHGADLGAAAAQGCPPALSAPREVVSAQDVLSSDSLQQPQGSRIQGSGHCPLALCT